MFDCGLAYARQPIGFGLFLQRIAILSSERRPDRLEIVAGIKPVGNSADVFTQGFAVTHIRRARELVDLSARVVDVIFAGNVVPSEGEQTFQRVTKHGATAMADVHRPRRICRNIFDIDRLAAADITFAKLRAQLHGAQQRCAPGGRLERDIDETGTSDLDFGHQLVSAKPLTQCLGKLARLFPGIFCQHHGDIGCHVAVSSIARRLHGDARQIDPGWQTAGRNQIAAGAANAIKHFSKDVLRDH